MAGIPQCNGEAYYNWIDIVNGDMIEIKNRDLWRTKGK